MLRYLATTCCAQLNYFPAKHGVSAYFSPHAILSGQVLDYNKFRIPFGSFVQACHEANPYNTQAPRMLDCIYLRPSSSGHELLHLGSGKQISRPCITVVPMSDSIINAVEDMAFS